MYVGTVTLNIFATKVTATFEKGNEELIDSPLFKLCFVKVPRIFAATKTAPIALREILAP